MSSNEIQRLKPVYILSGFLGSGKTTVLNKLLKMEAFSNTLVIVNEFGEVALDHLLIETSSDTILELSNGCLCCSIRGEMVDTLLALDPNRFDRVIIETTGIADPLPVFQSLAFHPVLAGTYAPAEILVVYDCLRGENLINQNDDARKQLSMADVIIPSKLDICNKPNASSSQIRKFNELALIVEDLSGLTPEVISQRVIKPQKAPHSHSSQYASHLLETEQAMDVQTIAGLLHHLVSQIGSALLRIKGFAKIDAFPEKPMVIQVSGQVVHDFEQRSDWNGQSPHTQLVVITKNCDPKLIQTVFDAFIGNLAIDTPDKAAITNNPLAMPGFEL
jgi:G3E family GTPase